MPTQDAGSLFFLSDFAVPVSWVWFTCWQVSTSLQHRFDGDTFSVLLYPDVPILPSYLKESLTGYNILC